LIIAQLMLSANCVLRHRELGEQQSTRVAPDRGAVDVRRKLAALGNVVLTLQFPLLLYLYLL
jgi:hypothetical protein